MITPSDLTLLHGGFQKEVKQTPESNAVVEVPSEKVEIEDCSDDSEQNGVTAVVQLTAKRSKEAAEETETKVEVTAEKVEVESDEEEEDESDSSDVAETLEIIKKPKSAADVEESKKQSSIPNYNQNDNSIGIIVTTTPPTPTTTTPTVAEVTEQQQEKGMKESRVIEVDAEQKEIAEKGKGGGVVAQVTNEIKKEQVTVDSDEAEIKPQQSENAVELAALQAEISTTQVETTQTPIKAAEPKQQPQAQLEVNSNDTIKDIKSDISSNIEQENIATLKRQQKELLEKQQELAQQIRQQQLVAQQLACENRLHQQQLEQQKQQQQSQQEIPRIQTPYKHQPTLTPYQPQENISKYSTIEETKDEHGFTRKTETYESKESSNATKHIDLRKIFTPATDTEEILPRNRKLYASSAFYSPGLHPTVEDQVELARRISNSLSDISNQKSKGQSMYVNRKKRSVKWVHEGSGQDSSVQEKNYQEEFKENNLALGETTSTTQNSSTPIQVPLRLLMNPRGKVRDITSVGDSFNIEASLLSPDKCAELVTALQTQKGKGAELFAKRRRKSEKWVVDETNTGTQSPSGLPDYHQHQQVKPPTSPSILPAYSDAGKHRVQLNLHQEQVLEKYVKPGLKVIKTPWEAALETGSASSAFVEDVKLTPHHTPTPTLSPKPAPQYQFAGSTVPDAVSYNDGYTTDYNITPSHKLHEACFPTCKPNFSSNPQRDLAYKPSLPQGWKAPSVTLPKASESELRRPKEEYIDKNKVSKPREFLDYLIRSPELRVSPISTKDLLAYNNAIGELKENRVERHLHATKQHQEQQQQQQLVQDKDLKNEDSSMDKREKRIMVREQLELLETYQSQLLEEQQQEIKRLRQRERRMQQQQKLKLQQLEIKVSNQGNLQNQEEPQRKEEAKEGEEEYVKIAVRELISNYEQQLAEEERCAQYSLVTKTSKPAESSKLAIIPKNKSGDESDNITESIFVRHTQPWDDVEKDSGQQLQITTAGKLLPYVCVDQRASVSVTPPQSTNSLKPRKAVLHEPQLYLPKEISLESYAPPPVVNIKQPEAYNKPSWKFTPTPSPVPSISFPLAKPNSGGGVGFLSYGATPPPKQQYYEPTSYRTVPQSTTPNVTQISYNPSPLSYEKIAKFENVAEQQLETNDWNSQPRRLGIQSQGANVRNASPAQFGERSGSAGDHLSSSSSPYQTHNVPRNDIYERATTPIYTKRQNINKLLHGQNYNNTARGWRASSSASSVGSYPKACGGAYNTGLGAGGYGGGYQQKPLATANDLPYTDF
ncbi:mediator of RNA polymerase II transcription subunit 15 [Rhagoletis pomonella]|uniref:mediator of RNA polymerase II transcription subunit 15 n=1 Tax=Rhagoletis pomonella TaxID=28610 RepID=UPI00178462E9|nr:mediator of RNA polymerase II transcription subunit 15 [Rhagoletis pomonella]